MSKIVTNQISPQSGNSVTINGDVSIGGTLTYEDVTNIDVVGVITARSDVSIADKIIHTGDTNTAIRFPAADTFTVETAGSERLRIDANGHMGLGVTPSAWAANGDFRGLQVGGASLFGRGTGDEDRGGIAVNYYHTGSAEKYIANGNAARIYLADGNIHFSNAPANSSGAGAAMTLTERLRITSGGDVSIASDSKKLLIGAGDDLQLYHDGSNSYIDDAGTGALYVRGSYLAFAGINGEQLINAEQNAAVELFYDNSRKLETTSSGITVTGNVGIGTNPALPSGNGLEIHHATVPRLKFSNSTTGSAGGDGFQIYAFGSDAHLENKEAGNVIFYTSGTERVRIDSSGNVLIGATSYNSTVKGVQFNQSGQAFIIAQDNPPLQVNRLGGDGTVVSIRNDSSQVGTITVSGSATAYNTSSDYRLKENVVNIDDGITRVKQLQPKRFNFIDDDTTTVDGFLAHEAQDVVPEAVTGEKDGEEMQGIDQAKLVPLLTAALQEAIAKIETLESKVAALEVS